MQPSIATSAEWLGEPARAQIRAALDAIITIDQAGVVVEWNPSAEQIFGYSSDEAIGTELAELIVPHRLMDAHRAGMAHYFSTGEGPALDQRLELPGRRADGSEITVELTITAFEAEGRKWFTGYARDISELTRIREELMLSEQRFRAIVEGSSDIITILNADGSWRFTSESGTRITGYEKGFEPEGGILALLHPDDSELALNALQSIISGDRSPGEPVELRIIGNDGAVHWFETTGVNMLDDPAVEGVVLHARDVTDRRAADDAVRLRTGQMAGIMNNLNVGVLVEDDERRVVAANQAFADTFGIEIPAESMTGADCVAAMRAARNLFKDPEGFVASVEMNVAKKRPVRNELLALTDGRYLERDYVPVRDQGQVKGHIWLYRDVTEELELTQRREEMLELERHTRRQVEEQNEALRELDELKTQLVATASHELRTPLASIVSFADLLADGHAGAHPPEEMRFIDAIQRNADRLLHLVDDLLLLARLESKAVALLREQVAVGDLIAELVENARARASDRSISIELHSDGSASIEGDRSKLTQVIDNLISNAVKFTSDGGEVTVVVEQQFDTVTVAVSDTGIGIPSEDLDRLFERFFRADNARKNQIPGTGLGLSVSLGLVELHGGSLAVESAEGVGTTMTVTLPKRQANA